MGSIAAAEVAREVIRTVGKGRKPHLTKIAISKGYSLQSARVGKPIQTKTYKAEIKPLVSRLEEERDAIMERLKKTRNKAKYRDLIDGMDKVTKNIQLLTGGATQNIAVGVKKLKDDELAHIAEGG
jgi:hypothetical protein